MTDVPSSPSESDAVFEMLAHPLRRRLLGLLREYDQTDRLFLDTLSAALAEREDAQTKSSANIAVELHHWHLPKLDATGLIRYAPSTKMVEFAGLSGKNSTESLDIVVKDD